MKEQSEINRMLQVLVSLAKYTDRNEMLAEIKSAIQKDRRELVSKAVEMARENNEGVEITICPEMKYTQQQILEKLEVSDV